MKNPSASTLGRVVRQAKAKLTSGALSLTLGACLATSALAQGVPIDTSGAAASFSGSTLLIQRLNVPGLGVFDAQFAWDGEGNFRFAGATPSTGAPGPGTGPVTPPAGALRSCQIVNEDGTYDIEVYADRLQVTMTATGTRLFFNYSSIVVQQGANSGEVYRREVDLGSDASHPFYWQGEGGFEVGFIPRGAVKRGTIYLIRSDGVNAAPWFNPGAQFVPLFNLIEEGKPC